MFVTFRQRVGDDLGRSNQSSLCFYLMLNLFFITPKIWVCSCYVIELGKMKNLSIVLMCLHAICRSMHLSGTELNNLEVEKMQRPGGSYRKVRSRLPRLKRQKEGPSRNRSLSANEDALHQEQQNQASLSQYPQQEIWTFAKIVQRREARNRQDNPNYDERSKLPPLNGNLGDIETPGLNQQIDISPRPQRSPLPPLGSSFISGFSSNKTWLVSTQKNHKEAKTTQLTPPSSSQFLTTRSGSQDSETSENMESEEEDFF